MSRPDLKILVTDDGQSVDTTKLARRRIEIGGEPPDNDFMDQRIRKLEEFAEEAKKTLVRIETKLESTVTKADLTDAINAQIKWMVGTAAVLGAAAITIMTFVLNNATPKAPTVQPAAVAPAAPPIIINVPPAQQTPAPAPPRKP
ncbi:hypothetical protein [Variovorax paradoxus]|uniref:hypothetical protein n=1 Tax=Variovorax paradoxus TaxID=34073 RepID=UPI00247B2AB4